MFKKVRNHYFRFFLNLTVLVILLFILDRIGGTVANHFYFTQTSGPFYRTTFAIDSTTAELLVFGSSRANHHYVPEPFVDSLKISFYNTGRDGNYLLFNYAIFQSVIKRHKPEIIILDINPGDLNFDKKEYDCLSSLLPYYSSHPEIRKIVEMRGPYEKYKLLSAIYPYNSSLLTIAIGNLEYNKKRNADRKGYVPLFNQLKDTSVTIIHEKKEIDSVKFSILQSIMRTCKLNNIRLINVISPVFDMNDQGNTSKVVKDMAERYDAEFFDFSQDILFNQNPSWFQDVTHLNNEGATRFSAILAGLINKDKRINQVSEVPKISIQSGSEPKN